MKKDDLFRRAWRLKDDLGLVWLLVAELEDASWGALFSEVELGKHRKA